MTPELSVIVPVRNDPDHLRACLESLRASTLRDHEVIVVDDASTDATPQKAREFGVVVLQMEKRSGPAAARNRGASTARGTHLLFVDADVCVHPDTLSRVAAAFAADPTIDALFGSYDRQPGSPNFLSHYKNLFHHFVHQQARSEASTFWSGCGAIKRSVFLETGGFDESYRRPCIEDIELGRRLRRAGRRIVVRKEVQATHLKRWTLFGLVGSDVWDRGVPWTELALREGHLPTDLNLTWSQRATALLVYALVSLFLFSAWHRPLLLLGPPLVFAGVLALDLWSQRARRVPVVGLALAVGAGLAVVAASIVAVGTRALLGLGLTVAVVLINLPFYAFFARERHPLFAALVLPLHLLYYCYSGLALGLGVARHASRRLFGRASLEDRGRGGPGAAVNSAAFKAADAASYDDVSEAFDCFSERFSAPLADRLVTLGEVRPGQRVLDVGTGTGIVALRAAAAAGPAGTVVGIDLSEGMLEKARTKARVAGVGDRLEFRCADAEAMDLPESSQDVVLSLFALLHFPDPAAALREIRRVLRPGGRLALGVGSPPAHFSRAGLRRGLRRIGELLRERRGLEAAAPRALEALVQARLPATASDEVTHLEGRGHRKPRLVQALVRDAGFVRVRTCWEGHEAVLDTPEEFWELQRTYSTRARKRLAAAAPDLATSVREELLARAARVRARGGRLVYRHAALFVVAERPGIGGV